jgi:hypothetical protein
MFQSLNNNKNKTVRDENESTTRRVEDGRLGNNNLASTTDKPINRPRVYESLGYSEKFSLRLKLDQVNSQ